MSFPLARTMICGDVECNTVYDAAASRVCPTCQSAHIYPIQQFFRLRDGREHTRATVAELVRLRALKSA
jgi:hypothetical protein